MPKEQIRNGYLDVAEYLEKKKAGVKKDEDKPTKTARIKIVRDI